MRKFVKGVALANSALLAGALIAYNGGYTPLKLPGTLQGSSEKSLARRTMMAAPCIQSHAVTVEPQALAKEEARLATAPALLLPGSKSFTGSTIIVGGTVSPSAATKPAAAMAPGTQPAKENGK